VLSVSEYSALRAGIFKRSESTAQHGNYAWRWAAGSASASGRRLTQEDPAMLRGCSADQLSTKQRTRAGFRA